MAGPDQRLSDLEPLSELDDADLLYAVHDGNSHKVPISVVKAEVGSGGGSGGGFTPVSNILTFGGDSSSNTLGIPYSGGTIFRVASFKTLLSAETNPLQGGATLADSDREILLPEGLWLVNAFIDIRPENQTASRRWSSFLEIRVDDTPFLVAGDTTIFVSSNTDATRRFKLSTGGAIQVPADGVAVSFWALLAHQWTRNQTAKLLHFRASATKLA